VSGYSGVCFEIKFSGRHSMSGRPLMVLFACITKLGSGAYGARHARVRPSIMQWVLAIRETVVIKQNRLNIVAQGLSNSLPHTLP